ncbi:uncharacterized protein LOC124690010 [Lolium rigidum]|uniref:uncharacterized protein LOC124690010 n=1 Tax=Lolium rigidum TaxID=89674 RepID=UPI001F5DD288|nr:uncharacterized protein LOC124690010 [Lolium rigidum]
MAELHLRALAMVELHLLCPDDDHRLLTFTHEGFPPPPLVYTSSARSSFPAPLHLVRQTSPPTQLQTVTLSAAPLLRPRPADRSGDCTNFSPTAVLASHHVRRHFRMSLGRQCQASILLNGKSTITFTRKGHRS